MTKTYKHKTLGWIAEKGEEKNNKGEDLYCVLQGMTHCGRTQYIKQALGYKYNEDELIALGFEEVVEKDWIDDVINECNNILKISFKLDGTPTIPAVDFRRCVEKHAPKQKKITKKQFQKVASDNNWGYRSMYMNRLRNLLYDNDLIEDFEY